MENSASAPSPADLLQAGYRFALALTHHHEEAEDLVQETWLNLCRRYGRVENQAILFTALRNLFIDHCRRKKLAYFEELDEGSIAETHGEASGDEPGVAGDLNELLARLKPNEREVIFLHYYEGHTAEEIGTLTGQSRGTVLSLLHRTMAKLRKHATSSPNPLLRIHLLLWFVTLGMSVRLLSQRP